jgi:hypothetical protein
MNRDCGVETAEEVSRLIRLRLNEFDSMLIVVIARQSHIPEKWRTKALSQVKASDDPNLPPGCDVNSQSFCYIDSESSDSEGQYIDLVLNPERFTGYAGESAHRVWGAIYEENCFGLSERVAGGLAAAGESRGWEASGKGAGLQGGFGTEVKKTLVAKKEEECLEKRIYYRIISGKSCTARLLRTCRSLPSSTLFPSRTACKHQYSYLRRLSRPNDRPMGA